MDVPNNQYTILIIEDEGLLSRMYSKKFEIEGFKTLVAETGEAGIEIANNHHINLIICDMMMPGKGGLETLKELKQNQQTSYIPVLMLSNLADEPYVQKALELQAVGYMIKNELLPAEIVHKAKQILNIQAN